MRICFIHICIVAISFVLFSCKKDSVANPDPFFGQWTSSYGDTIEFSKQNGKNVLLYDESLNPTMSVTSTKEFRYKDEKLEIIRGSEFYRMQSFKWNEIGKSFEIQGVEWFQFMSSTTTFFTFTKIR